MIEIEIEIETETEGKGYDGEMKRLGFGTYGACKGVYGEHWSTSECRGPEGLRSSSHSMPFSDVSGSIMCI